MGQEFDMNKFIEEHSKKSFKRRNISASQMSKMRDNSSKQKALNAAVDKKWDKINAEHGKTPSGKRKWHYYNSKV
jgi:hypothetical protein